jgi:hypothetical protein
MWALKALDPIQKQFSQSRATTGYSDLILDKKNMEMEKASMELVQKKETTQAKELKIVRVTRRKERTSTVYKDTIKIPLLPIKQRMRRREVFWKPRLNGKIPLLSNQETSGDP